MTPDKFARLHPDVSLEVSYRAAVAFRKDKTIVAGVRLKNNRHSLSRALDSLSYRILTLNARAAAAKAGWRDQNTGEIRPLSAHHLVKRSQGRNDAVENLAALGLASHARQHERKP